MIDSVLSEENIMFRDAVRKFAEEKITPNVKTWEKEGKYPDEYYRYLAEMGFMGLLVPEEYGGAGGSMVDLAILCEEMGRAGVSIPLTHVSACCRAIVHQGNEDQKRRYLPDMASGKKIGAYCQTEPNAGSDAGNLSSFAEKKDGYYLLNGRKVFHFQRKNRQGIYRPGQNGKGIFQNRQRVSPCLLLITIPRGFRLARQRN